MKKANEIFIPGALPESTYVTRMMKSGFTYEARLKQALSVSGYLTLISGPSKIGKTVLCEKVIGLDHLIEISGADMMEPMAMWTQIGMKAGMPLSGTTKSGQAVNDFMEETYYLTKENVLAYYQEHDLVLLMDDFHYASDDMQEYMAQQFKDAIRKGLRVVIASLPHRIDDTVRTNPDLQGRISIIDMQAWSREELKEIPRKGFAELGISISDILIDWLAEESICSPQLMQLICLNICILAENEEKKTEEITDELVERAFRFSTLNLDYEKVSDAIRRGKNSRGQRRTEYRTDRYGDLDLYGLILEALAIDPPVASIEFADLADRISKIIVDNNKPSTKSLKEYLKNLQDVLNQKDRSYEVIEWKDDKVYILEALFLFFLRWGREDGHME